MPQNKCFLIPSNKGENVFLFQLSKCIPIPEPEILMYSESGRNGYHQNKDLNFGMEINWKDIYVKVIGQRSMSRGPKMIECVLERKAAAKEANHLYMLYD